MRGKCPNCSRMITVRNDGQLRLHGEGMRANPYNPRYCQGVKPVPGSLVGREPGRDVGWFADVLKEPEP